MKSWTKTQVTTMNFMKCHCHEFHEMSNHLYQLQLVGLVGFHYFFDKYIYQIPNRKWDPHIKYNLKRD